MKNYDIEMDPILEVKINETSTYLETTLEEDYKPHLTSNGKLYKLLLRLHQYKRAEKVFKCGNYTAWAVPTDFSEKPFLVYASFCKDRLCALCSWRRSLKIFSQVSRVMDEIQGDYRYIFVTLTLRNVPSGELVNALDHLSKSFHLFMTYAKCHKAFKGYFKAVEITRNKTVAAYEWHPHLHIIFAVDKNNYFSGKYYIRYKELRELWQRALGVDYAPQVSISAVKTNKDDPVFKDADGNVDYKKAICEVSKYALKPGDLFSGAVETQCRSVLTLTEALKGRRLCSFGGILKETARKLKLEDLEEGDLTDQDKLRSDVRYMVINCSWQVGVGFTFTRDKNIYTNLKRRKPK